MDTSQPNALPPSFEGNGLAEVVDAILVEDANILLVSLEFEVARGRSDADAQPHAFL